MNNCGNVLMQDPTPQIAKAKLKTATTEHMQALEKSPERVKKFFQDARVKYAA